MLLLRYLRRLRVILYTMKLRLLGNMIIPILLLILIIYFTTKLLTSHNQLPSNLLENNTFSKLISDCQYIAQNTSFLSKSEEYNPPPLPPCEKSIYGRLGACQRRSVNQVHHDQSFILVTGGAGFIGSNLVDVLLSLGYNVRVFDNLSTGYFHYIDIDRVDFHYGSILNRTALNIAMDKVVLVYHLGAASKVKPSLKDPKMATFNIETNSVGTSLLIEAAISSKTVKKIIYAASSTVYGNQELPYTEWGSHFVPSSPYAASKYMGELEMLTATSVYKIPTVNLRFFMVYGPRQPKTGGYAIVTGAFIDQYKNNQRKLSIEGSGDQFRDFIHVYDVCRALIYAANKEDVSGITLNVGSGQVHSINELASYFEDVSEIEHLPPREHDLKGTLASPCLAHKTINFKTIHNDFQKEMTKLIKDELNKPSGNFILYTSRFMYNKNFIKLSTIWSTLNIDDQNEIIRNYIDKNGVNVFVDLIRN